MFDLSLATILTGFAVSTIGFSLLLYGKRQGRLPQLVVGGAMMGMPLVVTDPWWMAGLGVALIVALVGALRSGR